MADIDFVCEVGQRVKEFLCNDIERAKFYKVVIDYYYKNKNFPLDTIKKITDYLSSTKTRENLNTINDIKVIIQEGNTTNFLGCVFFPLLFEPDAIMRPDISDQLSIYVKRGGDIQMITRTLMEHYRGIPNMINVIARIINDVTHEDSQKKIKQQVQNATINIFKMYKMDNLLLTQEKVPKEFKFMFHDPFWADTIISLFENTDYSNSLFIAYCMNKICKSFPEKIKSLPPFYISYRSFQNVLQYNLSKIKNRPDLLNTIIKIISTDDLTLIHAAFIFHDLPQEAQIKITDKLNDTKRSIFKKISLNMDPACDMKLSSIITNRAKLRKSDLQYISNLEDISPHMKSLIIKKVSDVLKDKNNTEEITTAAIDCLVKITDQTINDDDHYFINKTFENIHKSSYKQIENLSTILYSVKFPYFNDIINEIAISQLNSQMDQPADEGQSPQSQIIREVAYMYKKKIPIIVDSLIKVFKDNESSGNIDFLSNEIFYIFTFLVKLGYSKIVLKKYAEMMKSDMKSPHLHRTFVMNLFRLQIPKYFDKSTNETFVDYRLPEVCRFIEAISYLFDQQSHILDKIIPESSANILSTFIKNLRDLKKFLAAIPDNINISEEAMDKINYVRGKLQYLNI